MNPNVETSCWSITTRTLVLFFGILAVVYLLGGLDPAQVTLAAR